MGFITIAGLIGVGKSTLVSTTVNKYGWKGYYEPVEHNPYLEEFYTDPASVALAMEFYLLDVRTKQHLEIAKADGNKIQDRSIYEDIIFVRTLVKSGVISELDAKTYYSLADTIYNMLPKPDVILYLKADPQTCLSNIKSRDRKCEQNIPLEYLKSLSYEYDVFMQQLSQTHNVITVDYNQFVDIDVMNLTRRKDMFYC